ncbi:poly(A) polymerase [Nematocida sp. LUAm2]|nr:poly(A) polymerase [Nematocida sp. LUAm2]
MEAEDEAQRETEKFLREQGVFEDEKEAVEREKVLGILCNLVNKFVCEVAQKNRIRINSKNMSKIFTFGSYRLGVHSAGADIDTLCIVPNFISREMFFSKFYEELGTKEYITKLSKVENTFVPLIKFTIYSIPIDLLFARLDLLSIPSNIDLLDNKLLKHMNEKCILSINGNRVTDEILSSVPDVKTFHLVLRFIKYWAQARFVYGHSLGYPGGVAYAICVAKAVQMYPNTGAFETLSKFFSLFFKWQWPQPVIIKEVVDCNYNLKMWNPKVNYAQRNDKMPVITPVYPAICSTHNITTSTLTILKRELSRGIEIFEEIASNQISIREGLEKLCAPTDFFSRHKNYFVMAIAGDNPKEFSRFLGFSESRFRMFATKLENIENISLAYVFPKKYVSEDVSAESNYLLSEMGCKKKRYSLGIYFLGIEFSSAKLPINASRKMNLKRPVDEFKTMISQYEPEEESEIVYDVLPMKQKKVSEILELFSESTQKNKKYQAENDEEVPPKEEILLPKKDKISSEISDDLSPRKRKREEHYERKKERKK